MKTIRITAALLIALGSLLHAPSASAQTPTNPPAGTFFNSVQDYFTSFNTNLDSTFATAQASLWTGADSLQGGNVNLANSLGVSYNLWKAIAVESVTRNSGVAGTLVSEQAGLELNFIVHDAKLTLYADGGYDFDVPDTVNAKGKTIHGNPIFGEIGVRASKALTEHTFAGVGIGAQLPENRQVFQAFAGFTF